MSSSTAAILTAGLTIIRLDAITFEAIAATPATTTAGGATTTIVVRFGLEDTRQVGGVG